MAGEKKHAPSWRKLQKAKEQGDVARSLDLTHAIAATGAVLYLWLLSNPSEVLLSYFEAALVSAGNTEIKLVGSSVLQGIKVLAVLALPFIFCRSILGIVSDLLQAGCSFRVDRLYPQLSRLNPCAGLKRILGAENSADGGPLVGWMFVYKGIKYFTLLCLVLGVSWVVVKPILSELCSYDAEGNGALFIIGGGIMGAWFAPIAVVVILEGIIDYFYEARARKKRLMMDDEELRNEYRELEGDPHYKNMRRQVQRELSEQMMIESVRKSRVIITDGSSQKQIDGSSKRSTILGSD